MLRHSLPHDSLREGAGRRAANRMRVFPSLERPILLDSASRCRVGELHGFLLAASIRLRWCGFLPFRSRLIRGDETIRHIKCRWKNHLSCRTHFVLRCSKTSKESNNELNHHRCKLTTSVWLQRSKRFAPAGGPLSAARSPLGSATALERSLQRRTCHPVSSFDDLQRVGLSENDPVAGDVKVTAAELVPLKS